jgi:hypothetical protein
MTVTRAGVALLGTGLVLGTSAAVPTHAEVKPPPVRDSAVRGTAVRGSVVSAVRVAHMSPAQVRRYLHNENTTLDSPAARYGVDTYRVVYRTISVKGRPTTASGVVALPASGRKSLRPVSFTHGTHAARSITGSVEPDGQSRVAAILFAGSGYAGVAPDYLGLGLGPGFHPYGHAASEASASLDLLRAARRVAASHGRKLERRVLVTGYSQGGQAAMALGRELQRGRDRYLRLGALAPISGPYDLRHAEIPAALNPKSGLNARTSVFYLSYAITTWDRLYHLYDSPTAAFKKPYAGRMEKLFDGRGDFQQISPKLPATVDGLLTARYRRWLLHPSGKLLRALNDADGTCDWRPRVPVRLYGASGDEQVAYSDTRSCVRSLRAHGVRPQLVDYGPKTDHFTTMYRGLPDVLRWFRTLR